MGEIVPFPKIHPKADVFGYSNSLCRAADVDPRAWTTEENTMAKDRPEKIHSRMVRIRDTDLEVLDKLRVLMGERAQQAASHGDPMLGELLGGLAWTRTKALGAAVGLFADFAIGEVIAYRRSDFIALVNQRVFDGVVAALLEMGFTDPKYRQEADGSIRIEVNNPWTEDAAQTFSVPGLSDTDFKPAAQGSKREH